MKIKNEKEIRVVIAAGGDGTRMAHISKGKPKSFLPIGDKPLIAYQIELFKNLGLKDIMLSFNNQEQIDGFKKLINSNLVPANINYSFSTHELFDHPGKLFNSKGVRDYIEGHDIFYTQGDVVFESSLLENMISAFKKHKNCVIMNTGFTKPTDSVEYEITDNFILGSRRVACGTTTWRDGGLFIIPAQIQHFWLETFAGTPSTVKLLDNLSKKDISVYVEPLCKTYININTETDYNRALEYFGVK